MQYNGAESFRIFCHKQRLQDVQDKCYLSVYVCHNSIASFAGKVKKTFFLPDKEMPFAHERAPCLATKNP